MSFQSKLPATVSARIADFFETPLKADREGGQHDIRRSSLHNTESRTLAALVRHFLPGNSLEVGLGTGGSCVAISAMRQHLRIPGVHIALDPFQETDGKGSGLLELQRLGLADQVRWLPERSECYLHDKWQRKELDLDFAFVDGGHDIGQKVTDAFYLHKVLRPGGVIAFHDALLISTVNAVSFLVRERGYSILPLETEPLLRRVGRAVRHLSRIGPWYAIRVVPRLCRSLVAMQKPLSDCHSS